MDPVFRLDLVEWLEADERVGSSSSGPVSFLVCTREAAWLLAQLMFAIPVKVGVAVCIVLSKEVSVVGFG
jgi:hypothetical protein